jgi:hypothetical protein
MIRTPVVLLAYARPDETLEIINILRQAKVRKIYFFVDAVREFNEDLHEKNLRVKSLISQFDWNCELHYHFFDTNMGPFSAYNFAMKLVFEKEDELIYLEDDKYPSLSFFFFCDELLEKYRTDERILFISGLNFKGNYPNDFDYDYFFAEINTTWGHALWKRTYKKFELIDNYLDNDYYRKIIDKLVYKKYKSRGLINMVKKNKSFGRYDGHVASMEYYLLGLLRFLTSSIVIVPRLNQITDVGASEFAVHGDDMRVLTKQQRKLYFKARYEIESPLRQPP